MELVTRSAAIGGVKRRVAPEPSVTDPELLAGMLAGDTSAFATLYARHRDRVYRFALLYAGSDGVAADVTQEVFIALMDGVGFDPARGPLEAYLLGMARNLARRQQRHSARHVTFDETDVLAEELADDSTEPMRLASAAQHRAQVRAAILALPAHQREVVILCELEELEYHEVASLLGIPIGTVRSRLSRARRTLTQWLALIDTPRAPGLQEETYELRAI